MKYLLVPITAALLSLTACVMEGPGVSQRYHSEAHFSYPLRAGGSLSVEGFEGAIDVSGWDREAVEIEAVKSGPTQQAADDLKIEISNAPDKVSVRAVKPPDRRGGVRFTIRIPRAAVIERLSTSNGAIRTADGAGPARLRTTNGSIRVQDLKGALDAQTTNAGIELLDIEGDADVRTSNGRIRADRLRGALDAATSNSGIAAGILQAARPVRLETSNGSVELTLPAELTSGVRVATSNGSITVRFPGQVNARLMAHTSNASISSDFEIKTAGTSQRNQIEGTIGNGGPLIDLGTSNGSIRLLKM